MQGTLSPAGAAQCQRPTEPGCPALCFLIQSLLAEHTQGRANTGPGGAALSPARPCSRFSVKNHPAEFSHAHASLALQGACLVPRPHCSRWGGPGWRTPFPRNPESWSQQGKHVL